MNLDNLETPALILDMDAFEHNIKTMKGFLTHTGLALRPHYKSHKSTYIAHRQIQEGAKGITCAKLSEAEDLIQAGIEDVLIANQILQPSKLARAAYLAGCCRLTVCVDHEANIIQLEAAAAVQNTNIHILVEYDVFMRRCGVDTPERFLALARTVDACPHLIFDGIQAYAGHLSHEEDYEKRKSESDRVEKRLKELMEYVQDAGLTVREVSGTSTGTIEFRPKDSVYTEVQAGSYIFMDAAYKRLNLKFKNALFILTQVISKNDFIIADVGMKSVSLDQTSPIFQDYPDLAVDFSEEHCKVPAENLRVEIGDHLLLIPGHCCTTVNLHNFMYLARGKKVLDRIPITSRGMSL